MLAVCLSSGPLLPAPKRLARRCVPPESPSRRAAEGPALVQTQTLVFKFNILTVDCWHADACRASSGPHPQLSKKRIFLLNFCGPMEFFLVRANLSDRLPRFLRFSSTAKQEANFSVKFLLADGMFFIS